MKRLILDPLDSQSLRMQNLDQLLKEFLLQPMQKMDTLLLLPSVDIPLPQILHYRVLQHLLLLNTTTLLLLLDLHRLRSSHLKRRRMTMTIRYQEHSINSTKMLRHLVLNKDLVHFESVVFRSLEWLLLDQLSSNNLLEGSRLRTSEVLDLHHLLPL